MILIKTKKMTQINDFPEPKPQTEGSAGADLHASIASPIELKPLQRILVPTGWGMEIPQGYEGQIRSRSGWASKHGLIVLNAPGTIDSDYRGEIIVILYNSDPTQTIVIKPLDRIAQIIISPVISWTSISQDTLSETQRNDGGFGSTKLG